MSKTKTNTKASLGALTEVKKLKREIINGHEVVEGLVLSSKGKSRQALAEALLEGKRLTRVKTLLGYGSFTRWVATELKGKIGHTTVTKYIRLAEEFHHGEKQSPTGLRKAYIMLGIIDDDNAQSDSIAPASAPNTPPFPAPIAETSTTSKANAKPAKAVEASSSGLAAKLHIVTKKAEISTEDQLSRAKFLVKELLFDIQIKIQTQAVTPQQAHAATLEPLEKFFASFKVADKK
jgi:hypothetical protein